MRASDSAGSGWNVGGLPRWSVPTGQSRRKRYMFGTMNEYMSSADRIENVITVDSSSGLSRRTGSTANAMASGMRNRIARNGDQKRKRNAPNHDSRKLARPMENQARDASLMQPFADASVARIVP